MGESEGARRPEPPDGARGPEARRAPQADGSAARRPTRRLRSAVLLARRYAAVAVAAGAVAVAAVAFPSVSRGSGTGPAGAAAAGVTPAPAPGSPGVTVSGVYCRPGVRQVPWSRYVPICVPAWHGDNGGATSHGVTATTITITYREVSSLEDFAVAAAAGSAAPAADPAFISDMNTYIRLFNRSFELYGRHVVLRPFHGRGDYLLEDQGQDLAAAEADAVTARDLGAFADATFYLTSSEPYEADLAAEHVIAFGAFAMPHSWFAEHAPYEWSIWPSGTKIAEALSDAVCERMAGLPAIFAGAAALRSRQRTFALIAPDNPTYQDVANDVQAGLERCGVRLVRRVSYKIDVSSFAEQATAIVAELASAQATTVLCACDPLLPAFLTSAANAADYHPEWLTTYFGDGAGRLAAQNQWAHAIANGGQWPPRRRSEAYRVFELADPGGHPAEPYYRVAYYTLVQIFDGLQAAGPDLTPQSFERGMWSLPRSLPGGNVGPWAFRPGSFTPEVATQLGWWDPTARSNFDGERGAWENCEGGRFLPYADPAAWGPAHTQLACFGRAG